MNDTRKDCFSQFVQLRAADVHGPSPYCTSVEHTFGHTSFRLEASRLETGVWIFLVWTLPSQLTWRYHFRFVAAYGTECPKLLTTAAFPPRWRRFVTQKVETACSGYSTSITVLCRLVSCGATKDVGHHMCSRHTSRSMLSLGHHKFALRDTLL